MNTPRTETAAVRPPIACVVFDFDGTLVDSNAIKRGTYYEVAARFGDVSALVDEVLGSVRGDRAGILAEIVRRAEERGLLPGAQTPRQWFDEALADYTAICERRILACEPIPGALDALESLRERGCPLYVNSATPMEPLARILRRRGMDHFFRGIYGAPAPKVENLHSIRRETGLPWSALLVVGDGEEDRRAAEETGCQFFGVASPGGGFGVPPAVIFPDLFALPAFVMPTITS
jgi:phosphoglycolate phosphatase-like HAD superfamily hydrolase